MSILQAHVKTLFAEIERPRGELGIIPVLGGWCERGEPLTREKRLAVRALLAREWFAVYGPPDAPPLPLSPREQEALRYHDPFGHIVAEYARSLQANGWDFRNHPSFEDFARGDMASGFAPDFIRENPMLLKRFPPRPLPSLGPGAIWEPCERQNKVVAKPYN